MIVDTDHVDLASGVSIANGHLEDVVRGASWPLNQAGAFVLGRAGRPLEVVVSELSQAFDLPLDIARRDVLQFVWTLNALALVNIVRRGSRIRRSTDWLVLAARLAPVGALPGPVTRRWALDTGSVRRGVLTSARASFSRVVAIAAASTITLLPLVAVAGGPSGALALALGAATGIGVGVHEAGHVASLNGVPSALVLRGVRTFVLHAPLEPARRARVAIAGPVAAVAAGLALVGSGAVCSAPSLVIAGLPLAAHALSLTVVGGDGRSACGI